MFCPECKTELIVVIKEGWANKLRCPNCQNRYEQVFPDRMGGYYRQYDLSVFDKGFTFKEENENILSLKKDNLSELDLRD